MKNDFFWFLLLFIGFGLLWFIGQNNGNQSRLQDGLFIDTRSLFSSQYGVRGTSSRDIAREIKDVEKQLDEIEEDIARLQKQAKASPLKGKLSISGSAARRELSDEYVSIKVSSSLREKIEISGLELYSPVTGKSIKITGAVEIPKIGVPNVETAIYASPGDTILVATGNSPVGMSFRTNMCTGYFSQYQTFLPSLTKRCPTPDEEAEYLRTNEALLSSCMDYLEKQSACRIPSIESAPGTSCKDFIKANMNYNSCVSNHFGDTDFPGKEWRVYLNQSKALWKDEGDVIELLDRDGKVIDYDRV